LPIYGALFRDLKSVGNSSNELLMIISPTILNPDKTFLSYGGSTLEDEMENVKTNANNKGVQKISAKANKKPDDDVGDLDDLDSELDAGTTSVKPDNSGDDLGGDALDDLDSLDDIPEDLL
jgi:Flp pilus assembly secretin CpaC